MGILTRQENEFWVLEVKEKFFCTAREAASNIQELLLDMKLCFEVDVEPFYGQDYITLSINQSMYRTTNFDELLNYYKRLMITKQNFGQRPKED